MPDSPSQHSPPRPKDSTGYLATERRVDSIPQKPTLPDDVIAHAGSRQVGSLVGAAFDPDLHRPLFDPALERHSLCPILAAEGNLLRVR